MHRRCAFLLATLLATTMFPVPMAASAQLYQRARYSATVILQLGEAQTVSWGMPVTMKMAGYRYYITNSCEWDTDGNGTLGGTGTRKATYSFRISE